MNTIVDRWARISARSCGWIAGQIDIGFHVEGFWTAVWGSLVITLVNTFIDVAVLEDDD